MFAADQMVTIHATDELPTIHDGAKGQVRKRLVRHSEFYEVLVWTIGEYCIFHESQLTARMGD
jgi:hypothetical protein